MQCPKCGYAMGELEQECKRCGHGGSGEGAGTQAAQEQEFGTISGRMPDQNELQVIELIVSSSGLGVHRPLLSEGGQAVNALAYGGCALGMIVGLFGSGIIIAVATGKPSVTPLQAYICLGISAAVGTAVYKWIVSAYASRMIGRRRAATRRQGGKAVQIVPFDLLPHRSFVKPADGGSLELHLESTSPATVVVLGEPAVKRLEGFIAQATRTQFSFRVERAAPAPSAPAPPSASAMTTTPAPSAATTVAMPSPTTVVEAPRPVPPPPPPPIRASATPAAATTTGLIHLAEAHYRNSSVAWVGVGASIGAMVLFLVIGGIVGSSDEKGGNAIMGFGFFVSILLVIASIITGFLRIRVSTRDGDDVARLTVAKQVCGLTFSRRMYQLTAQDQVRRVVEPYRAQADAQFGVLALILLMAGAIPGIIFIVWWLSMRSRNELSLCLLGRQSHPEIKLYSGLIAPNSSEPPAIRRMEEVLGRVVRLREGALRR